MRPARACAALLLLSLPCGCNLIFGAAAAMQPYYSAGDLAHDYRDRAHATQAIDCLDLALDLVTESERTVLEWRMGNRCNGPVTTDLSRAVIVQRRADGSAATLTLEDPAAEIGPRDLAPRRAAFERIAVRGADRDGGSVCVDARGVVDRSGAPPPTSPSPPMCFRWDGRWIAGAGS